MPACLPISGIFLNGDFPLMARRGLLLFTYLNQQVLEVLPIHAYSCRQNGHGVGSPPQLVTLSAMPNAEPPAQQSQPYFWQPAWLSYSAPQPHFAKPIHVNSYQNLGTWPLGFVQVRCRNGFVTHIKDLKWILFLCAHLTIWRGILQQHHVALLWHIAVELLVICQILYNDFPCQQGGMPFQHLNKGNIFPIRVWIQVHLGFSHADLPFFGTNVSST